MALNGIQQLNDLTDKGRPGLSDKEIARLIYYFMKGIPQIRIAEKLKVSANTVNKYTALYREKKLPNHIVEAANGYKEVTEIAKAYGVAEEAILKDDTAFTEDMISVFDVVRMDTLVRIVDAAVREASGEYVKEKITGAGVRRNAKSTGLVSTKFGYDIDDETKVILDVERQPPDPKNFIRITEFLKMNGIDVFERVRNELGINTKKTVDLSEMSPADASAQYTQMLTGETDD